MLSLICLCLTHLHVCPASNKRNIGKHCRPISDAAERGVWSGSTLFTITLECFNNNNNNNYDNFYITPFDYIMDTSEVLDGRVHYKYSVINGLRKQDTLCRFPASCYMGVNLPYRYANENLLRRSS